MFTYVQPCSGAESNTTCIILKYRHKKENKKIVTHTVTPIERSRSRGGIGGGFVSGGME